MTITDHTTRTSRALAVAIVIVILALLAAALYTSHEDRALRKVEIAFLGFTNSSTSPEALFALTNPPEASVSVHSVRGIKGDKSPGTAKERGAFSWGRREPWGVLYAIGVDTTNEPLQVVLAFQQRARSPRRLIEQARELYGRLVKKEREFFTGQVSFVTNQTQVAAVERR